MKIIPTAVVVYRDTAHTSDGPVPAFPLRKGSSTSSAERWSNNATPVEVPNHPRGGFRIVGAEQRAEGGRAWKVVTPENDLVDMREDVFLPILLTKGLPPGGVIDAEFQWGQNGSQMRLLEVGSAEHAGYQPEEAYYREREALAQKREEAKTHKKANPLVLLDTSTLRIGFEYAFSECGCESHRVFLGHCIWNERPATAWAYRDDVTVVYDRAEGILARKGNIIRELQCAASEEHIIAYRERVQEWTTLTGARLVWRNTMHGEWYLKDKETGHIRVATHLFHLTWVQKA